MGPPVAICDHELSMPGKYGIIAISVEPGANAGGGGGAVRGILIGPLGVGRGGRVDEGLVGGYGIGVA